MFVNKSRNPSASEILSQLFLNKELRGRVLTTLGLLLLVRLGIYIPMPGIDRVAFKSFIDQGGQLIGFLDIFTGGGISTLEYSHWVYFLSLTHQLLFNFLQLHCLFLKICKKMKEKLVEEKLLK